MREIGTKGGYVNVLWTLAPRWSLVLGAGMDDPDDDDLAAGNRSRNTSLFGNVRYRITKQVIVGLEVDRMATDYLRADDATNDRFQLTFMLKW